MMRDRRQRFLAYLRANPQETVEYARRYCRISTVELDEWKAEPDFLAEYRAIAAERRAERDHSRSMPRPAARLAPHQARRILGWVLAEPEERTIAAACVEFGASLRSLRRLAEVDDDTAYLLEQAELAIAVPIERIHHRGLLIDEARSDAPRRAYLARKLPEDYGKPPAEGNESRQPASINFLVQVASDRTSAPRHDTQGYVPTGLDPDKLAANDTLALLEPKEPAARKLELPDLDQLEGAPS